MGVFYALTLVKFETIDDELDNNYGYSWSNENLWTSLKFCLNTEINDTFSLIFNTREVF